MPSKPTIVNPRGGYPLSSFKDEPLMQLRVLYSSFVKGLFGAQVKGAYHWSEGDDSEIFVTDEHPVKAEAIGARPAVSFTRSAVQFYSLGQDDMLDFRFDTGRKTKSVLIPGTMSINCSSRVDLESERIAWIIAEHLWLLREHLMGIDLFFEIGRQAQVSPPTPAEGVVVMDAGDEWYCTTVTSPFQFPRTSQVTPLNRKIVQNIELQIRTRMLQLKSLTPGGPTAGPNGVELGVQTCERGPSAFFPEASDARGRTPDPGGKLPSPPQYAVHPLDPSRTVVVRTIHPFRPGLRPPSMGGRAIPIAQSCVEESSSTPPLKLKV
jgi:hypothetical protein